MTSWEGAGAKKLSYNLTHKKWFKTGQTMPKQGKQSEKEKPRKPHGFGVFELF